MIYVGPLSEGGTCLQRMRAFQELGLAIHPLDTQLKGVNFSLPRVAESLLSKAISFRAQPRINAGIVNIAAKVNPAVVWIDKGIHIRPTTIQALHSRVPKVKIVSYSPDDMFNPQVTTMLYRDSLPYYDLHVTTKSFNVEELRSAGAQDVFFIDNAYDPSTHRPLSLSELERAKFGGDIGFIGSYEEDRENLLVGLAASGKSVRVWGKWPRKAKYPTSLKVEGIELWGESYIKALNSFSINLCFLRKVNRDQQTTRSIEIPACAAFMLAERTTEHQRLFQDRKEAVFFSTREELSEMCTYYLQHEQERRNIALAGRSRCLSDGYSNQHRLGAVLDYMFNRRQLR